jgi:hypothetical protein
MYRRVSPRNKQAASDAIVEVMAAQVLRAVVRMLDAEEEDLGQEAIALDESRLQELLR